MSDITKVNTGAVKSGAENILAQASSFKAAFDELYNTIHALRDTWTSADGNSYIAKIDSYQEDFENLYANLVSAATGFSQTADNYSETVKKNML